MLRPNVTEWRVVLFPVGSLKLSPRMKPLAFRFARSVLQYRGHTTKLSDT